VRAGANAYVAKPVERNLLVSTVKAQIAGRGQAERRRKIDMAGHQGGELEALGKPLGQYSHMTRFKNAVETLYNRGNAFAPGDDFDAQCTGVFRQIATRLRSAGAGWGNVVQFTTYLVHSQDIPKFHGLADTRISDIFSGRKISAEYPFWSSIASYRKQFLVEVQTIAAI